MLLFVLACGLAVTLGLMNFVNLAHGAFAMAGGYATVVLMNRLGLPFLRPAARLPGSARSALRAGAHALPALYTRSHLDQVLFSIGLVFMAMTATDYLMGSPAAEHPSAGLSAGPHRICSASASAATGSSSS
jgi:branched-chain amino acid transport system permease protein